MNNKKSTVHQIFSAIYILLAIATLIPMASASKASLLGYKSLCSFSPIGTIILILLSLLHILLYKGVFTRKQKA